MDTWVKTGGRVIRMLLGNRTEGSVEFWVLAIGGLFVLLALMGGIGKSAGVANRGLPRRICCAALGLVVCLAAACAVVIYLFPIFASDTVRLGLLIVVPIVAAFLLAAPLQMLILRSSYSGAAVMFVSSAVVAAILITLSATLLDAVRGGRNETKALKQRNRLIEDVLGE
jgi:hypothetical protein